MRLCLECAASVTPSLDGMDFTLQGPLVDVTADPMVHLDHRRQRALSETCHRAHRELAVRSCQLDLVALGLGRVFHGEAEFQANALQQVPRTPRVARRSAADTDSVVA